MRRVGRAGETRRKRKVRNDITRENTTLENIQNTHTRGIKQLRRRENKAQDKAGYT
jgi:hypothetical protein